MQGWLYQNSLPGSMANMTHQFEYKGIHYSIDVSEVRSGGWTWSYQIQNGPVCKCKDLLLDSEETALSEAKRKVKWMIDHRK